MELKYCEYDVLILHYWIQEEIAKNDGKITKIPLTQTGYIRRDCRKYIFDNCNKGIYKYMIKKATPDTNCFICLSKAFAGGDTHANYLHVRQVLENVGSFDFASCYPAVMVKCKYPREFKKLDVVSTGMFENLLNKKACVFKIGFEKIVAKRHHHTLSLSKCETYNKKTIVVDNGRVVEGEYITTYMTDIDYKDFEKFYDFEGRKLIEFYYSDYEYLPKPFIEYILQLFKNKTELKGLTGELNEALYMKSKQHINGLYGMCVTNIANENAVFSETYGADDIVDTLSDVMEQAATDFANIYANDNYDFETDMINWMAIPEMQNQAKRIKVGQTVNLCTETNKWVSPILLELYINHKDDSDFKMTFTTDYTRKPLQFRFADLYGTITQTSVTDNAFTFNE